MRRAEIVNVLNGRMARLPPPRDDGWQVAAPLLIGGPHVALLCGRAETEAVRSAVGKVETCVLVYYTRTRKPTHPFRPQMETRIGAKFFPK